MIAAENTLMEEWLSKTTRLLSGGTSTSRTSMRTRSAKMANCKFWNLCANACLYGWYLQVSLVSLAARIVSLRSFLIWDTISSAMPRRRRRRFRRGGARGLYSPGQGLLLTRVSRGYTVARSSRIEGVLSPIAMDESFNFTVSRSARKIKKNCPEVKMEYRESALSASSAPCTNDLASLTSLS